MKRYGWESLGINHSGNHLRGAVFSAVTTDHRGSARCTADNCTPVTEDEANKGPHQGPVASDRRPAHRVQTGAVCYGTRQQDCVSVAKLAFTSRLSQKRFGGIGKGSNLRESELVSPDIAWSGELVNTLHPADPGSERYLPWGQGKTGKPPNDDKYLIYPPLFRTPSTPEAAAPRPPPGAAESVVPIIGLRNPHPRQAAAVAKGIVLGANSNKGGCVLTEEAQKVDAASHGRLQKLINLEIRV
ncbi:Protein MCM10-like protein [Frankliniella fusca]|uniref:Protein MCM10-like protein n=1 Tax=Frankliniella fusca TaxID=407009 RepID=A0AAE1I0X2_9NEOP|nr:Protein MCM10-like protein [Frankliniella fusca]